MMGEIRVGPRALKDAFGVPLAGSGDGKTSGQYRFSGPDGSAFSLYYYKLTSLYDAKRPTPEAFWNAMTPVRFSIGARDKVQAAAFKTWLLGQIHHLTTCVICWTIINHRSRSLIVVPYGPS